jgi:hypothetical protein
MKYKIEMFKNSNEWYVKVYDADGFMIQTGPFKTKKSAILNQVVVWYDMNDHDNVELIGIDLATIEQYQAKEKAEKDAFIKHFENRGDVLNTAGYIL